ncbi:MAG: hypothetical protein ACM3L8_09460, partial [Verrucomicrobiota bacterium]
MSGCRRKLWWSALNVPIFLWIASSAFGGWEVGVKGGFDTNLNRSISDKEGSGFVGAYGGYTKGHSAESRLDWTLGLTVQGYVYPSLSEVNYAAATVSPGLAYILRPGWMVAVTPFLQGKAVQDSEQSAWAFGGRVELSQKFQSGAYAGEYYVYTDSRANEDVYSYTENAVGAYLGMRWDPSVFTEVGYEFSRGDSFFTMSSAAPPMTGGGGPQYRGGQRYSSAFNAEVFKETVDTHSFSVSAGIDWTQAWFSAVSYTYKRWNGDSDSASSSS